MASDPGTPTSAARRKVKRFTDVLAADTVDKRALAELAWSGVPLGVDRREVWQILLDYRPTAKARRVTTLQRKRQEYQQLKQTVYNGSSSVMASPIGTAKSPNGQRLDSEGELLKQIRKDLPRLDVVRGQPGGQDDSATVTAVVQCSEVQAVMERVLFIWAVRQPVSGYVQGIDGILLMLVLQHLADGMGVPPSKLHVDALRERGLLDADGFLGEVEADCYWCVSKLLSEMYDHYTEGFPGIRRMSAQLEELLRRVDAAMSSHLEANGINTFEIVFRWTICVMVRELPVAACARLWDALISESAQAGGSEQGRSAGFDTLLLYFCACFMARFSGRIRSLPFEEIMMLLAQSPAEILSEADVEMLMAEAFVLKSLFQQAPSHLSS